MKEEGIAKGCTHELKGKRGVGGRSERAVRIPFKVSPRSLATSTGDRRDEGVYAPG